MGDRRRFLAEASGRWQRSPLPPSPTLPTPLPGAPSRPSRQVERKPDGRLDLQHLLNREYGNAPLDQRLRNRGDIVEVGHATGGQAIALIKHDFDGDISDGSGNGRNGDRRPHPLRGIAAQKYHRPLPDGGRKLAPPHPRRASSTTFPAAALWKEGGWLSLPRPCSLVFGDSRPRTADQVGVLPKL